MSSAWAISTSGPAQLRDEDSGRPQHVARHQRTSVIRVGSIGLTGLPRWWARPSSPAPSRRRSGAPGGAFSCGAGVQLSWVGPEVVVTHWCTAWVRAVDRQPDPPHEGHIGIDHGPGHRVQPVGGHRVGPHLFPGPYRDPAAGLSDADEAGVAVDRVDALGARGTGGDQLVDRGLCV